MEWQRPVKRARGEAADLTAGAIYA
jgi:hypothetical protein